MTGAAESGNGPEPLVRARFCQEWLTQVEAEEDPYRGRFFAHLPRELRERIESASRVAWLPMAIHVHLAEIQLETFGSVRAHEYYRHAFVASMKGPIFGPLLMTGARVLGLSPGSFVRWASRGYAAAYKDAGDLHGEVLGSNRARLVFSGLPPVCTASEAWLMSSQGSTYGMYDVLGIEGVVRLDMRGRAEGKAVLDLEWSDRKLGGRATPPKT